MFALVEGKGFRGSIDGRLLKLGFVTNRDLAAATVEEIDQDALFERVRSELLRAGVEPLPGARLWISKTSYRRDDDLREFNGFSFYPEESWLRRILNAIMRRSV
jgi:hypothetical protein